ncbi:MAG: excinuclease ABC subunit UvrC [Actinobacteria bacterium]|jgi:excinuclease ABC subunit C|nr:excinuclease ABC subunit UvrC [Actinomycetota bacterium]NCZ76488.1 excinuclease ABC subunit UvrC [Actinomycetota bacterium]NDD78506.1 excinuclease ABC subunit UvrC [Actinomycetota bacterium]NDG24796.1 excinuclease ABC subunit UvrC [Actinomycetota bacterium]
MADPLSYRPTNLPTDPGVYRFFDKDDKVIYVGKAKNLKNRINSYFGSNLLIKTRRMVKTAVRVDWTIVNSELEALQLEFTWIKQFNPDFNVQFKDDKSYPYLAIDLAADFPRLFISRSKKQKGVKYFGPYSHAWALRSTFETLTKIYPIRTCSESNFKTAIRNKRQCLLGDIGKCSAPCVEWITKDDHRKLAQDLSSFLEKSPADISRRIEQEMQDAAELEEFEKAARLRDQLDAVNKAFESTDRFLNENINADVLAVYEDITHAALSQFNIQSGRITGSRSWIVDRANLLEDEEIITAMIGKIYSDSSPPSELILDQLPKDLSSIEAWLSQKAGRSVLISMPKKGEKLEIVQLVKRNANQALIQYLSKRANDSAVSGGALTEIAEQLELAELPLRIECFDISNIQGTSMVASMVVFEDGQPKKSDYRRFSINDDSGFDDTRAMNHVITRRFKRYLEEKDIDIVESNAQGAARPKFAYPPQLVVVDGGKPQVNAAAKALRDLGITDIALCGLAKRLEEVWLPYNSEPIIFPRHSEALYLLQKVRDEAHRFAINFHRSKRSKLMLESLLDQIEGLGESRRKALLEKFGSVSALKVAGIDEISAVPGIGPKIAKTIFENINTQAQSNRIDMQTGEILDA